MATYDLKYPGAAIDAILDTAYDLQNAGYIFRGLASEYSNTPTERSWVLAGEGETGHGFTSPVPKGYIGVCVFNGTSWTGKLLKCVSIDSTPTNGSTNAVSSGGAYASISQLSDTVNEALDNLTFTDTTPSAFLGEYITEKVSTTDGGIERILTYFTILAATTSKAGLLSAADKQKLDAILGNLRSLEIDDTTAYADLGDKIVESIKATIGGTEETISTFQILAATASKAGLLSAADKAKLDALWSSGYQFVGIATPSTTPVSTTSKIFYIATEAGTYFNAVTVTQGINILSWNGSAWSAVQVVGIDDVPTAGSSNLIESKAVYKEIGYDFTEVGFLNQYGYVVDDGSTNKHTTDYIPAYKGHYRVCANVYDEQVCIAFYDYAKRLISTIYGTSEDWEENIFENDVPTGTYYLRVTTRDPQEGTYVLVSAIPYRGFLLSGDSYDFTEYGYFDEDGTFVEGSTSWGATDFIEIPAGAEYSLYLKGDESNVSNVLFYDKNKMLISTLGQTDWYHYTGDVPQNACYVRMCSHLGNNGQYAIGIRFGFITGSLLRHIDKMAGTNEVVVGDSSSFSEYGYFDENGVIHSTYESSSWAATPFIPIPAGAKYEAYIIGQNPITANILFYDIEKNLLDVVMATKVTEYEYLRGTAPANAVYTRLSSYIGRHQSLNDEWFKFSAGSVMPTLEQVIKGHSASTSLMYGNNFMGKPFSFQGKTAAFFGDSVTKGIKSPRPVTQADKCYREWLCERLGLTGTNYAVSSSFICDLEDSETSILNRVLNVVTASFETDFIFIAGGINDFWTGKPLGIITDDTYETFYGALNVMCEHLTDVLSGKSTQVIFFTPINCTRDDLSEIVAPLDEYRNAIFKVATMNGFNVVDTSKIGFPTDINDAGFRQATIADGVHPTEYGHKMMGLNLAAILL